MDAVVIVCVIHQYVTNADILEIINNYYKEFILNLH